MREQNADQYAERLESDHAIFWMAEGSVHKIRLKHLSAFYAEALYSTDELSKGAKIVRDAVKSKNAGRMTELLAMVKGAK